VERAELQATSVAQKQMVGPIKFDKHCVSKVHTKNAISFVLAFKLA